MDKVVSQDKRHALSVDPQFALEVAKEVAKVDVEELRSRDDINSTSSGLSEVTFLHESLELYLSSFPDHDIVVMTISDAQDVSSYTVASTGQRELLYCLIKFVSGDRKRRLGDWGVFPCATHSHLLSLSNHLQTQTHSRRAEFPPMLYEIYQLLRQMND